MPVDTWYVDPTHRLIPLAKLLSDYQRVRCDDVDPLTKQSLEVLALLDPGLTESRGADGFDPV